MGQRHLYLREFEAQRAETESRIRQDTERYRKAYATIRVRHPDGTPADGIHVRIRQIGHAFKFGFNLFMLDQFPDEEHNKEYRRRFPELFNYAIAPLYWSDFESADGQARFGENPAEVYRRPAVEKILHYCREHRIDIKGHPPFWHLFLPDWLVQDKDAVLPRIDRRFREISEAFSGRIHDWDVVNESLSRAAYPEDCRLPIDYVLRLFRLADGYFPANRLFINETTGGVWCNYLREMSAYYLQIENLLLKGVRLDAIGMQYHLFYTPQELEKQTDILLNPRRLFDVMDTYAAFRRPLHVSEITVPAYGGTREAEQLQAEIARWLYRIWFSHSQSEAIVWWNLVDATAAYAPLGSLEGENYYCGGLLRYDMSEKPVYKVLRDLIKGEWHTEETAKMVNGAAQFHGFYGSYEVVPKKDGRRVTKTLKLVKGGPKDFLFEL